MKITEMTMAHADAVNQFCNEINKYYVFEPRNKEGSERFLNWNVGFNFVAFDCHRVVGYIVGSCTDKLTYLSKFGVAKSHRKSQIAAGLLEHFSASMRARGVTHLEMPGTHRKEYDLSDLHSLKRFHHLESLHINHRSDQDLRPLSDLPQLSRLTLDNCYAHDYTPIAALTQLTHLIIDGSFCKDSQFLSNLTKLTHLKLRGNLLTNTDLERIAELPNLTYLNIGCGPQITDISPLVKLKNLTELYFEINENIQDFSPVGSIPSLRLVSFNDMRENLVEITFLRSLPHLTSLSITGCNSLVNLGVPACDLSPISDLTNLTHLDLSYNQIRDISFLLPLSKLTHLNLKGNRIQDSSPIGALEQQSLKVCITKSDYADVDWSLHGQDPGLQGDYS